MSIRISDSLERDHAYVQNFIKFCELHPASTVIFIAPTACEIIFLVTILGHYLGSIIVQANTTCFPNEGEYEGGVAIILKEKKMQKISMRSAHDMLKNHLEDEAKLC
jgi:hypothetical protein